MNDEILILNEYPIGWGWLKDVPLKDWEWLIDVFATMTDNTDTYSSMPIPRRKQEKNPLYHSH